MVRTVVVAVLLAGCHNSSPPATSADGASAADAAASADAPSDAAGSGCPVRTAAPGQPEGTVPPDAVHNGDYKISSPLDVDALAGILVITGDLTVVPSATELVLPDLQVIGGNFMVDDFNSVLPSISLPSLQTVGGAVGITAEGAMSFDVPVLDSTGFDFVVAVGAASWAAPCLRLDGNELGIFGPTTSVALPKLTDATLIQMTSSTMLTSLSLPAMTTVGTVNIAVPTLTSLSFGALATSTGSGISISGAALTSVTMPNLTSVTGSFAIIGTAITNLDSLASLATVGSSIGIANNPQLTELSGFDHVTTAGGVAVDSNATLVTLGFTGATTLTKSGDSSVENNPMLPTCQATALQTRVGSSIMISGNDDAGTCP